MRESLEIDLLSIEHYDALIRKLQLHLEQRAQQHDPQAYYRLRSVPGIGRILALTNPVVGAIESRRRRRDDALEVSAAREGLASGDVIAH